MAARSRPRGGQHKDEFDEERLLWNQIRADARRIDQLIVSILLIVQLLVLACSLIFFVHPHHNGTPIEEDGTGQ
jgi:hypothetical protein